MGKLTIYAHNLYASIRDFKFKPKRHAIADVGLAVLYPQIRLLQRCGWSSWTEEKQKEYRDEYYTFFPEKYTIKDLFSDTKDMVADIGHRCACEARYLIPSRSERKNMAAEARFYRERKPHHMGGMEFSPIETACASRSNYLMHMDLKRKFGGRFIPPK